MGLATLTLWLVLAPAPPAAGAYEQLAVDLLREYLQIDTTNPPGNEIGAARFFERVLKREGIPVVIDEYAPGRANVLAEIKGSGRKRPLVLASHMDVVPADPARWSLPPFAGAVKDGVIYGRGAVDMKVEGILHLVAMIRARRERLPLERDLLLLGTADEEAGFAGASRALEPAGFRARLASAEYVVTEGEENPADAAGAPAYFGVDAGEKGAFWLTLRTTGVPGHGSVPIPDSAPNRMIRALERIRLRQSEVKLLPAVAEFLRSQAERSGEPRAQWYRDLNAAVADPAVRKALADDPETARYVTNTISITVVRIGYKTNVIPGTAEAELDVRLLPGEDPDAFRAELARTIDDPTIEIVPPADFRTPNQSPTDSELAKTVRSVLAHHYPGVTVTTRLLPGATECVLYRAAGIACYGFTPLVATNEELASQHGDDERIHESAVRQATTVFYDAIVAIASRR